MHQEKESNSKLGTPPVFWWLNAGVLVYDILWIGSIVFLVLDKLLRYLFRGEAVVFFAMTFGAPLPEQFVWDLVYASNLFLCIATVLVIRMGYRADRAIVLLALAAFFPQLLLGCWYVPTYGGPPYVMNSLFMLAYAINAAPQILGFLILLTEVFARRKMGR